MLGPIPDRPGLADPAPIQHTLMLDRALTTQFVLDGIVTLACAATGVTTLDRQFEAVSQIAVADRIVVSKADLVAEGALAAFEARLQTLYPTARILSPFMAFSTSFTRQCRCRIGQRATAKAALW